MNIYNNLFSALDSLFAHPTWGMVLPAVLETTGLWSQDSLKTVSFFPSDAFYTNSQLP